MKIRYLSICLLFVLGMLFQACNKTSIEYDAQIPQVVFAAQELNAAIKDIGQRNLQISLIIKLDESSPESFEIRRIGATQVEIIGTDINGAMYGGLEVADLLRLGLLIENKERVPFVKKRGIEIYLIHWNVFTYGATGKHGITEDQTNPITNDYLRKSVRQALLTYPQIKGIGVTAGENADNNIEGEYSIENFIFNTYGRGIMDVMEQQPDRKVCFIFRQHDTGLDPIMEAFADFPDEFDTSYKYAIGHMYSMTRPLFFERRYKNKVEEYEVPCWLNLRNDDIFVLRWGNPDFVREYIQKMPLNLSPGFYMGSDGYVWGREFIARNPEMAGKLEIDKHWYNFRLWGQLAYDPELGRDYWEAALKQRFPGVNSKLLYKTWAAASEIIPQVSTATFAPNDAEIAPEGCIGFRGGFLTVDDYYLSPSFAPLEGSGIVSVPDWAKAFAAGRTPEGIAPLQVSDKLDKYAATAITALPELRKQMVDNVELQETLNDIESMAFLGRYYADKMRGAAKLAVFREDTRQKQFNVEAVAEDNTGTLGWSEIQLAVGNVSKNSNTNWRDEVYQIILNEGEMISDEDVLEFPRLECLLALNNEGRLALNKSNAGIREDEIWVSFSKKDISEHLCVAFEKGRLAIYRGTPDQVGITLFKTSALSGNGAYKFGITASKKTGHISRNGRKGKRNCLDEQLMPVAGIIPFSVADIDGEGNLDIIA